MSRWNITMEVPRIYFSGSGLTVKKIRDEVRSLKRALQREKRRGLVT